MELPSAVALGAAARLHRLGLTPSPGGRPRVHDAPLGGQRQPAARRRAGGRSWTNEEVLAELLEEVAGRNTVAGRRLGRKDADRGWARPGATVALARRRGRGGRRHGPGAGAAGAAAAARRARSPRPRTAAWRSSKRSRAGTG